MVFVRVVKKIAWGLVPQAIFFLASMKSFNKPL
jgi:hypothetical protein